MKKRVNPFKVFDCENFHRSRAPNDEYFLIDAKFSSCISSKDFEKDFKETSHFYEIEDISSLISRLSPYDLDSAKERMKKYLMEIIKPMSEVDFLT